ncbi:hypothetical protein O181_028465 [Austropuccinia psidii MF-1]|uniref:CCHC-type domain-containing protein n=1 Tax=Austropuccinia psidii MF-1 TaxID=1389203 RepID=A0A9Q3CTD2_9BASI|nr:hypothetical protein [Austropuccinia psidii MF-1]
MRQPPDHLLDHFGWACFHCSRMGHWRANCPNPGPKSTSPIPFGWSRRRTPETKAQTGHHFHRERVLQVQFVKHQAAEKVLVDSSASIHPSGSSHFTTNLQSIEPFCIFFSNSK